jgi:uncharacterized protein
MIVDCSLQPFDLSIANRRGAMGDAIADSLLRLQRPEAPPCGEWTPLSPATGPVEPDAVWAACSAMLEEANVDLAIYQPVILREAFRQGPVSVGAGAELRSKMGRRVVLFGGTPLLHAEQAALEIERQRDDLKITGVVIGPSIAVPNQVVADAGFPSAELLHRFLGSVEELGIRQISIHKCANYGPHGSPVEEFNTIAWVAEEFPDLTFQIVQCTIRGIDDSAKLAADHANVYLNLQGVFQLIRVRPMIFFESLARCAIELEYDKIVFASGCGLIHPAPLISAFLAARMPDELVEGYGIPQLDLAAKQAILGGTACRMLGLSETSLAKGYV